MEAAFVMVMVVLAVTGGVTGRAIAEGLSDADRLAAHDGLIRQVSLFQIGASAVALALLPFAFTAVGLGSLLLSAGLVAGSDHLVRTTGSSLVRHRITGALTDESRRNLRVLCGLQYLLAPVAFLSIFSVA